MIVYFLIFIIFIMIFYIINQYILKENFEEVMQLEEETNDENKDVEITTLMKQDPTITNMVIGNTWTPYVIDTVNQPSYSYYFFQNGYMYPIY